MRRSIRYLRTTSAASGSLVTGHRYAFWKNIDNLPEVRERTTQILQDRAAAGNLDQARIREIVLETVERVTGKRTDSPSVSEWLERWIRTERGAVAGRTMMRYE